jgi:hypothetical protein
MFMLFLLYDFPALSKPPQRTQRNAFDLNEFGSVSLLPLCVLENTEIEAPLGFLSALCGSIFSLSLS